MQPNAQMCGTQPVFFCRPKSLLLVLMRAGTHNDALVNRLLSLTEEGVQV